MNLRGIIISAVGHIALFLGLLIPSFLPARPLPAVRMVTVTAVTPQSISRLIEQVDRVEEPAEEQDAVPPAPVEEKPAIPTPEKKPPKPQTAKRSETAETPAKETPVPANAGKGTAQTLNLPGVQVDQEVDSEYLIAIIQIIRQNWRYPNLNDPNLKSVIFFEIGRDGKLVRLRVEDRSGNVIFDKSVYNAVVKSNPLPELPEDFPGMKLGVHLAFSY